MKNISSPPEPGDVRQFDEASIERLAALLSRSGLSELRLVRGASSVHLVKAGVAAPTVDSPVVMSAAASVAPAVPTANAPGAVRAPLYGIAHLTPAPGQPPFVTIGSAVEKGQTVVLVEAMKTFHAVGAERAGVVTAIRVEAGQEVQAGDVLLEIGDHV